MTIFCRVKSSQVTIICIAILTMQIVLKQLYISFTLSRRGNSFSEIVSFSSGQSISAKAAESDCAKVSSGSCGLVLMAV